MASTAYLIVFNDELNQVNPYRLLSVESIDLLRKGDVIYEVAQNLEIATNLLRGANHDRDRRRERWAGIAVGAIGVSFMMLLAYAVLHWW